MIKRILVCQALTIVAAGAVFYGTLLLLDNKLLWSYMTSGCVVAAICDFTKNRGFKHRKELGILIQTASLAGINLAVATASTWWPLLIAVAAIEIVLGGYLSYCTAKKSPMYRQQKPISVAQAITAFLAQILVTFMLINWII